MRQRDERCNRDVEITWLTADDHKWPECNQELQAKPLISLDVNPPQSTLYPALGRATRVRKNGYRLQALIVSYRPYSMQALLSPQPKLGATSEARHGSAHEGHQPAAQGPPFPALSLKRQAAETVEADLSSKDAERQLQAGRLGRNPSTFPQFVVP